MRTITMKVHIPAWITNDYLSQRDEHKYHCKNFNKIWTTKNKLLKEEAIWRCNELKTSLQQRICNICIKSEDTVLEHVNKFKYLGIWLDSNLNFTEYVLYLKLKLYAKIKLLGRVCMLLNYKMALPIYKTLILPVLDYCDFIYYGISARDQETLQRLQNCAVRAILQVDRQLTCILPWTWIL